MSRREFHLSDGSAHKFWAITVEGAHFTVQFGRIGTNGQTQVKEFDSADEAEKTAAKLIAEKKAKGYSEIGATAAAATPAAAPVVKAAAKRTAKATVPEETPTAAPEQSQPGPSRTAAVIPADTVVTRRIDLDPADWFWATWRNLEPLPRPAPQPFDPEQCAARLAKVAPKQHYNYGYNWRWDKAALSPGLSVEEACFWFDAMTPSDTSVSPQEWGLHPARQSFTKAPKSKDLFARVKKPNSGLYPEVLLPLAALVPVEELVRQLLDLGAETPWYVRTTLLAGFCHYIRPYLTHAQRDAAKDLVREQLPAAPVPSKTPFPQALPLAALLGMHDEVLPYVLACPDGAAASLHAPSHYSSWMQSSHVFVVGLGSASLVEFHARRMGLNLDEPHLLRAWLAHTEYAALDMIRDSILGITNKDQCDNLLETFCLVKAPEAAPHMLELRHAAKSPSRARQWLDEQPANAVAGLIPVAAGRGKTADAALEYLRDLKRRGLAALIEAQLSHAEPAVADAVRRMVLEHTERVYAPLDDATTPEWLQEALAATPTAKAKLPGWALPSSLPPLLVGDRRLNDAQVNAVLIALQKSTVSIPAPLVLALVQHVDRPLLDAFAWKLFELWQAEGALVEGEMGIHGSGAFGRG